MGSLYLLLLYTAVWLKVLDIVDNSLLNKLGSILISILDVLKSCIFIVRQTYMDRLCFRSFLILYFILQGMDWESQECMDVLYAGRVTAIRYLEFFL